MLFLVALIPEPALEKRPKYTGQSISQREEGLCLGSGSQQTHGGVSRVLTWKLQAQLVFCVTKFPESQSLTELNPCPTDLFGFISKLVHKSKNSQVVSGPLVVCKKDRTK